MMASYPFGNPTHQYIIYEYVKHLNKIICKKLHKDPYFVRQDNVLVDKNNTCNNSQKTCAWYISIGITSCFCDIYIFSNMLLNI